MKNLFKYLIPLIVWAIAIYFLSDIPASLLWFHMTPGVAKIIHAFLFFVLCFLTWRAFYFQPNFELMRNGAYLGSFSFCVVFGILDEYHRNFVSGREADFYNVVADIGGALLFVAASFLRRHYFQKDENSPES
ncbi:MAG: VanZ family protein [Ignavibacteriales bacterium]|nr:VanZ family protein [Ignavibacteriales bacterium]